MNSRKPPKLPTLRPQQNGWTPVRQQRFLDHLAASGSVTATAKAAGGKLHCWEFACVREDALADKDRWIEDLATERVLEGKQEVIERHGQTVAVRRPADVRLLILYLNQFERREMRAGPSRYESPKLSEQREKLQAEIKALAGLKEGEDA